ncbi:DUF397 domain-containing protein [Actinomadura violacea]|uniref:DUF397 domain-containing protein n=1 Tax=Actinomadura violacea TaxID=2819934 RepID=A0ABS3RRE3_9ACTN|nr:DUF397 domain-containing protein [Actinomadura violacea]MBO2459314.1 DUF397 domain-containing protein [Actinomadura violacea]
MIRWRKSTYSGGVENNCVELSDVDGQVGVRDSKNPDAGHLTLTRHDFTALVAHMTSQP